jgi:plastocyanin
VNSGFLISLTPGATYTVKFGTTGNYKLVCLLHNNMTGTVHVLPGDEALPYRQTDYDHQAAQEAQDLLSDASSLEGRGVSIAQQAGKNVVTAGIGEILATGGGSQTASVLRFLQGKIVVHVGDTVEFVNRDPVTPHTVTFGVEPMDPVPPSQDVAPASDNALQTTLNAPGASTNSGLLLAQAQDQLFLPQTPLTPVRFRVTFTTPGTYSYICALHDDLGMKGTVVVNK